ncbi:MAG: alpha-L-fucosidase, partial [Terriglobia bacterium]
MDSEQLVGRRHVYSTRKLQSVLRWSGVLGMVALLWSLHPSPITGLQAQVLPPKTPAKPNTSAQKPSPIPVGKNALSKQWFQDAKFGLFIHWGVYSVLGQGEWVMNNNKMSITEYEKLPPQFNPINFNAHEWVSLAKAAGMKYITITSKHHDGFAMYDSKVSDYDIVDRTPYKKDILKQLSQECQKQGLKLFFYHSHLDWHHPDYFPLGRTGQ